MTAWRWGCLRCLMTGAADGEGNALALLGLHEMFACPATAGSREEYERRMAWRAALVRRYPGEVPAYGRGWREGPDSKPADGGVAG